MKRKNTYLLFILTIFFIIGGFNTQVAFASDLENVNIVADKAITIDIDTNEIIYSKNADIKAQPASTTKLMTALLLSSYKNKDDMIPITNNSIKQPSSSVYKDYALSFPSGYLISADNVMKGLMLHSGNDMATMIAESISGNVDDFALLMNEKAKEFNMTNTHFSTPSGLDTSEALNGKEHYTTAYDLAILGSISLSNPWVLSIASLKSASLDLDNDTPVNLINGNKNLNKNGCIAGKTGFTTKAGRCLVALYERDNRKILGVVLGSTPENYFNDMENIINYSYTVKPNIIYKNGETVTTETLPFKLFKFFGPTVYYDIPFIVKDDVTQYLNDINSSETEISLNANINLWNLSNDTIVGTLTVKERNTTKTFNLYTDVTTKDLIKQNIYTYISILFLILIIIFIISIILMKKRKTK